MTNDTMSIAQAQDYMGALTEQLETIMPDWCCVTRYQERQHRKVYSEGVTIDGSDDHDCQSGTWTYTMCYYVDVCDERRAYLEYRFDRDGQVKNGRFYGSPKEAAEFMYQAALADGGNN